MLEISSHDSLKTEKRKFSSIICTKKQRKLNVYSSLKDWKIRSVGPVEINPDWSLSAIMF